MLKFENLTLFIIYIFFEGCGTVKYKNEVFKDLLTDEPHSRSDLIILQDPNNLSKFNLTNYHHVKNNLRVETKGIF